VRFGVLRTGSPESARASAEHATAVTENWSRKNQESGDEHMGPAPIGINLIYQENW